MIAKHDENKGLDDLLKKALADDLPGNVAAGMRDLIDDFRAGAITGDRRTAVWAWLFRRTAWAVLSVLMLVAGILLQGLATRNALADRISLIKTEIASTGPVRRHGVALSAPRVNDPGPFRLTRRNDHGRDS
jgi:hypothetical protein